MRSSRSSIRRSTQTRSRVAALAILVVVTTTAGGAGADAPDTVGWWWRAQTGAGPALPPPVVVPDGGLWVANDPTGPMAVAALRFRVGDQRAGALTLTAADVQGTPIVVACPAAAPWTKAEAGPWASRPLAACADAPVPATIDGATFRWDIGGLARDGVVDVVLVPNPGTFSVAFDPPGPDTLATTAPPATEPAPAPAPASASAPRVEPPFLAAPVGGTPNAAFEDDLSAEAVLPFAADAPTGAPVLPAARPARADSDEGKRTPVVALLAVVVIAVWVLRTRSAVRAAADHPLARPIGAVALERTEMILDA